MTQCTTAETRFRDPGRRETVVTFDQEELSSDAGALLLQAADRRTSLLERVAACCRDYRDPDRVEHSVRDLVAQRVFAIALGYEDINDHQDLSREVLLAAAVGKTDIRGERRARLRDEGRPLAGPATLNRLELGTTEGASTDRYRRIVLDPAALDALLVDLFLEAHDGPPEQVVLDIDATDDPLHGNQEGRFFHGYYNSYCYLPLYIFCGDFLLCARLRTADRDASSGSLEELQRIAARIRDAWPSTRILVRGDSGFCRESIMAWCEAEGHDYVLGLARNSRLEEQVSTSLDAAEAEAERSGERSVKAWSAFKWSTKSSWSRERTVISKAEFTNGKRNPRFIVTTLPVSNAADAERIYREIYCARGDMENRIKEQQNYLFADRTSSRTMQANQLRLYFSSLAYCLVEAIRRIGLAGTEMDRAQASTIRLRLFKLAAVVKVTARRLWVRMQRSHPSRHLFQLALTRLRAA